MNKMLAFGAPEYVVERVQWVPQPMDTIFEFFQSPNNLERIKPDWLYFKPLHEEPDEIKSGTRIEYLLKWYGIPYYWVTMIENWSRGENFVDFQLDGPFILWHHTHTFADVEGGVLMTDRVRYRLPFGLLGVLMHRLIVKRQVKEIFDYRIDQIAEIFSGGTYYLAPQQLTEVPVSLS